MTITGQDLIDWGHVPGPHFKKMLHHVHACELKGVPTAMIRQDLIGWLPSAPVPMPEGMPLRVPEAWPYYCNLTPEGEADAANLASVHKHMIELMRVPTLVEGAIMPDACPAGSQLGTIPVGGIVAAKDAIHPGMHSADICCSMAFSNIGRIDPKLVLDAAAAVTHFGAGGRPRGQQWRPPVHVLQAFDTNKFLQPLCGLAIDHFGTQGDGNHFLYVGKLGLDTVIVTHHGSRGPGAKLFKAGLAVAKKHTRILSPETPGHNAWIPFETDDGRAYWHALQVIREWTKASHYAIHDAVIAASPHNAKRGPFARFWNEHNFVFRKQDGLFYHAKGATPAWSTFAADSSGLTLIPLNMAEPILIVRGSNAPHGLGFAPHGAGRNFSRTAYLRTLAGRHPLEVVAEQAPGIDTRYYSGMPDLSELPLAYKSALQVRAQIESFGLAEVVDTIQPYGCIMAGEQPWDRNRRHKPAGNSHHWSEDLPQEDR